MWSTDGYDLHLVANIVGNRTFDLKTIYSVPAGTTFDPVFPFVLADPDPSKVSHGINVNPATGVLTFVPKPLVRNFIVTAVRGNIREPLHLAVRPRPYGAGPGIDVAIAPAGTSHLPAFVDGPMLAAGLPP